jgi:hypothetical protein
MQPPRREVVGVVHLVFYRCPVVVGIEREVVVALL